MEEEVKCPPCEEGLPAWMGTFSDLVTLLLTFFVLLLSFAKTETNKYQAALGSIREAFGGNTKVAGEVLQPGKSPDDAPTMIDSQEDVKPFPIDFLTSEGLLEKREINRASDEDKEEMQKLLGEHGLAPSVNLYEVPEGIKVHVKDKLLFKESATNLDKVNVEVFEKMTKLLKDSKWMIYVEGHAAKGEKGKGSALDAFTLSAQRAAVVSRILISRGVDPKRVTTLFYGDNRPVKDSYLGSSKRPEQRRVEFILRKRDLKKAGHKVDPK
jgi:chemotaxis protein MotB